MKWPTRLKDRLEDFVMPKTFCLAGATALPPVGIAALIGAVLLIAYLWRSAPEVELPFAVPSISIPAPSPEIGKIIARWWFYFLLSIFAATLWGMLSMWAYIKCHKFWHDEKPQWAKDQSDLDDEFEIKYMDCPYCEEIDPNKWHWVGECPHWGSTP